MNKSQKNKIKAISVIEKVLKEVEMVLPSKDVMIADLKMMSFKIRPLSGDIFTLIQTDAGFLTTLWKIGKVDQIVSENIESLDDLEKEKVFRYLESMESKHQQIIEQKVSQLSQTDREKVKMIKLEVFKDRDSSKSSRPN